jgi:hypothetical protein
LAAGVLVAALVGSDGWQGRAIIGMLLDMYLSPAPPKT